MAGASKEESKGEAEASTEEAPRGGSKEVSTSSKEDTSAADPTEAEKNAIAAGVKNLEEHGQIDDPVEPPARNARKFAALHQQDLYADPTITILPSNTKSILSRLYDPDRKQKPELWEHIKLVAPGPADQPPAGHIKWRTKDAVAAYCLKCRVQFTYSKGTSKTITRHMRAYHGLVSDITDEVPSETGKRPGSTSQAPPLKKRKPEVEQSAQVMLLKWVVSSFQPWSIVESPGIREFVRCLSSSFEMPTSSEMVAIAAENVEKVKVEVRRLLKDCEHYSIGCLPFVHQDKPYASVNVTFCTSSFERKSLSLGVVVGKCTKEALSSLLSEFSLPPSKVAHVAVTGGADSLNLGLAQGGDSCVLYQMDTIVEEACASSAVIDALVSFVVGDSSKHANTGFVQRAYTSLQALAESSDGSDLNEGQKMIIGALTTILKPFYDAYTTISGEVYPTVGLAIPVFRRIRDVLAKLDVVQLTTDFIDKTAMSRVKSFYNNLIKVFSTSFASILCDDPPLMWTVPLDPRLVHMVGLSVKEKESVMKQLVDKVKDGKLAVGNSGDGNDNGTKSSSKAQEPSTMGGIFWGDDGTVPENSGNETEAIASYAQANVNRYLTAVKSQRRIDDPLAWWNSNQNDFPELAGMARVWLGASAVGPPVDQRRDYPQGHIELMAFLHDSATLVAGV